MCKLSENPNEFCSIKNFECKIVVRWKFEMWKFTFPTEFEIKKQILSNLSDIQWYQVTLLQEEFFFFLRWWVFILIHYW